MNQIIVITKHWGVKVGKEQEKEEEVKEKEEEEAINDFLIISLIW